MFFALENQHDHIVDWLYDNILMASLLSLILCVCSELHQEISQAVQTMSMRSLLYSVVDLEVRRKVTSVFQMVAPKGHLECNRSN